MNGITQAIEDVHGPPSPGATDATADPQPRHSASVGPPPLGSELEQYHLIEGIKIALLLAILVKL